MISGKMNQLHSCFIDLASDDILRIIFDILLDFGIDFGRHEFIEHWMTLLPLTLSHVCRRWRYILLLADYPSTWSCIYSTSRRIVDLYLERSGTAELDVHITTVDEEFVEEVILPNSGRLRQLHAFFRYVSGDVVDLLNFDAPRLRSLRISAPDRYPIEQYSYPILSSEKLPNLSKLNIQSMAFPPNTGFTKLTHLCLYDCSWSVRDVFSLLQSNPALEELQLHYSGNWIDTRTPIEPTVPRILISSLRWVSLYKDLSILQHISILPTCALRLSSPNADTVSPHFQIAKLHLKNVYFTALSPDERGFAQYGMSTRQLARWLPRAVEDAATFGSVREMWATEAYQLDWGRVLGRLHGLQELHLGFGAFVEDVLVALTSKPGAEVVCPLLHEVHMSYTPDSTRKEREMLRDFVRGRYKQGVTLGKLNLLAERELADDEFGELGKWVKELVISHRGSPEASPKMEIPERFTHYRHASWASRVLF